jgi:hypothetical protein
MITHEWSIQGRAHQCATTGRPFAEGEQFYTLLFDEQAGYRREDLSEEAFHARPADAPQPFSLWRMTYAPPPPPPPSPLGRQSPEDLLRRYMAEASPEHAPVRFLLAVMLERKRVLKEIEARLSGDGQLTRIYEHSRTGEVFVVPDPQLRLDQLAGMQTELSALLKGDE